MLVKVTRNPLVETVRRALDSVGFALAAHGILVSEYLHPNGTRGTEYVTGLGKDGRVVASRDSDGDIKWLNAPDLTDKQSALIEAHAAIFAAI